MLLILSHSPYTRYDKCGKCITDALTIHIIFVSKPSNYWKYHYKENWLKTKGIWYCWSRQTPSHQLFYFSPLYNVLCCLSELYLFALLLMLLSSQQCFWKHREIMFDLYIKMQPWHRNIVQMICTPIFELLRWRCVAQYWGFATFPMSHPVNKLGNLSPGR